MPTAIGSNRWEQAQAAELRYWDSIDSAELLRICAEKPAFLKLLGNDSLSKLFDGKEVLEIGCGPLALSVASFYAQKADISRLVKVEPLPRLQLRDTGAAAERWTKKLIEWVEGLCNEGDYVNAPGEMIQYRASFDTVISYNVLDHVQDPRGILENAYSALRPGGHLLLGVDCLSVLGRLKFEHYTRRARQGSILVEAHPHSFLPAHMEKMLLGLGYREVQCYGVPGMVKRWIGSSFRPAFLALKPKA